MRLALIDGKKKRNLKSDDKGVASVIGAFMVVLMFTIALTIVVTKYVPRWMEDNEALHMKEISNQFAELKFTIDAQILNTQTLGNSEATIMMHTPIKLGTEGVPILARETSGTLEINSIDNNFTVSNSTTIFAKSMGNIRYSSNNRYFTSQNYIYENGAVVINQSTGQTMKIGPQFVIRNESNGFYLSIVLVYLVGEKVVISGTDAEEIRTQLFSYQSKIYYWGSENITFAIKSNYKSSWENYFNNTMESNAMDYGEDYLLTSNNNGIIVTFYNIKTLNIGVAGVNTKLTT